LDFHGGSFPGESVSTSRLEDVRCVVTKFRARDLDVGAAAEVRSRA